jgi:creatinine amidohydrolase
MKWEELTGGTFEQAVQQAAGVCAIPIGVIEYHGPHLPLGTDMMHVQELATAAAEREPVIVYPQYHFGVNVETKHYPGGIVIKDRLMFDLLENICEEVSRNGLKKIVLLSGHGGNRYFLPLFTQLMLDKGRDFTPYYVEGYGADPALLKRLMETTSDGHAGESESSVAMHLHSDLVRKDLLPDHNWLRNEERLSHLGGVYTPADWFAMHPEHCAGDPGPATAEKGKPLFEDGVARVAGIFKKIKEDQAAPAIYAEFTSRIHSK